MAKDTQKVVPLTEEQLIEKEAGLKAMAQEVSEAQENFILEKNQFEEEKAAFEIEKSNFETQKTESEQEKEDLKELLEQAHEKIEILKVSSEGKIKSQKKSDPVSFEFEGEKYQFSESAPQSILLNGKGVPQQEIAKDDELKLQLIGGNSSLIIKK